MWKDRNDHQKSKKIGEKIIIFFLDASEPNSGIGQRIRCLTLPIVESSYTIMRKASQLETLSLTAEMPSRKCGFMMIYAERERGRNAKSKNVKTNPFEWLLILHWKVDRWQRYRCVQWQSPNASAHLSPALPASQLASQATRQSARGYCVWLRASLKCFLIARLSPSLFYSDMFAHCC